MYSRRRWIFFVSLLLAGIIYFLRVLSIPHDILSKADRDDQPIQSGKFDLFNSTQGRSAFNPNKSRLRVSGNKSKSTWKPGTFCETFIERTYSRHYRVCMSDTSSRIDCIGNDYSGKISICTLRNTGFQPSSSYHLDEFADGGMWLYPDSISANLRSPQCKFGDLSQHVKHGGYMERMVKGVALAQPKGKCEVYIKGKVFIHSGHAVHIYFKMLGWYNLFVAIEQFGGNDDSYIFRLNRWNTPFLFPELEVKIFGNTRAIEDIPNGDKVHCADEIIIVPWGFASVPFRCKNDKIKKCFECNGTGLTDTYLSKFRAKVLQACGLVDNYRPIPTDGKVNMLVILRKPYIRFTNDKLSAFKRVLKNQDELIDNLKKSFPRATVNSVFMEDYAICDQIRMVHEADILMGRFCNLRVETCGCKIQHESLKLAICLTYVLCYNVILSNSLKSI